MGNTIGSSPSSAANYDAFSNLNESSSGQTSSFGNNLLTSANSSTASASADASALNTAGQQSNEASEKVTLDSDLEKARDSDVKAALGSFSS